MTDKRRADIKRARETLARVSAIEHEPRAQAYISFRDGEDERLAKSREVERLARERRSAMAAPKLTTAPAPSLDTEIIAGVADAAATALDAHAEMLATLASKVETLEILERELEIRSTHNLEERLEKLEAREVKLEHRTTDTDDNVIDLPPLWYRTHHG